MRKIINAKDDIVRESLEGFISAHERYYVKHPKVNGIQYRYKRKDKVALVIGGGSGHEPMFAGFVGRGLADAATCGNIFASPDPRNIYETAKAADSGKGVLFVYGCYAGDNLNFDMAEEMLNRDGIPTAHVRVQDDVASAPPEKHENRRGIAGDVFVVKTAGAACDAGLSLEEAARVTAKANAHTYTIGVATSSAQLPGVDEPIFTLGEDEIEFGMGLHGEKGIKRVPFAPMDELIDTMYAEIKKDAGFAAGEEVCVLVNGLGATTITEMSIGYRRLRQLLTEDGIRVHDADIAHYCTSQEMGGFSITLFRLDDELKKYYDMPCHSPYFTREDPAGAGLSACAASAAEEADYSALSEDADTAAAADKEDAPAEAEGQQDAAPRKMIRDLLDAADTKAMLLYVADQIIGAEPLLTRLDSEIGDGDHGIGMRTGMKNAEEALRKDRNTENAFEFFENAGQTMLMSMGGASGVIFGSLFRAGAEKQEAKTIGAEDLAGLFERSLEAIKERGKAEVGDKTMVDALEPAVRAMKENAAQGLKVMLQAAEEAAHAGAEATKDLVANFGRAKNLGERALGHEDAGAVSTWLIFRAMRDFVNENAE
ncbi:MAG: dihydroxyacetone kinase subunit L [Lachnospiraceae bacterium]|nr:dihydroxyacetone kinase subunit L [Lachnospiraceae bacterium]